MENTTPSFRHLKYTLSVLAWLPIILFLDSPYVAQTIPHNQWIANIITLFYFAWFFNGANTRLKWLMFFGVLIAIWGEVTFSLYIGMYEYRLENVPIYVPPGHTIVYAAVYYFTREPWVRRNAILVRNIFVTIAISFAVYWLVAENDVYGFICTAIFMSLVAINKDSRLFFPVMYCLVLYLELLGTSFGNWYWHPTFLDRPGAIPSGNPPSGISVFYFCFDIGCLGFYLLSHLKIRNRYDTQKANKKMLLETERKADVASWHMVGW